MFPLPPRRCAPELLNDSCPCDTRGTHRDFGVLHKTQNPIEAGFAKRMAPLIPFGNCARRTLESIGQDGANRCQSRPRVETLAQHRHTARADPETRPAHPMDRPHRTTRKRPRPGPVRRAAPRRTAGRIDEWSAGDSEWPASRGPRRDSDSGRWNHPGRRGFRAAPNQGDSDRTRGPGDSLRRLAVITVASLVMTR